MDWRTFINLGLSALILWKIYTTNKGVLNAMSKQEQQLNDALQKLRQEVADVGARTDERLAQIRAENPDLSEEIASVESITADLQKIAQDQPLTNPGETGSPIEAGDVPTGEDTEGEDTEDVKDEEPA